MRKIIILSISIFFTGCVNKQDPVYKKYHTMSCSEIAQEHKKGFDYLQNKGKEERKKNSVSYNIKEGINLFTGGAMWSDEDRELVHKGQVLSYIAREKNCDYRL